MLFTENHKKIEIRNEFKEALGKDDGLYEKWVQYAERLVRLYNNGNEYYFQGTDVVAELIVKTIEGVRVWDKERVSLSTFMYKNIKSIIYNKSQREYKKIITRDNYTTKNDNRETRIGIDNFAFTDHESIDEAYTKKEFYELLEKEIMDDDGCIGFYLGIRENRFDHTKNKEISEVLGMKVKDVENLKKRFMRKCDNVFLKFYGNPPKEHASLSYKSK